MTPDQRKATLNLRKQKGWPWHSPPHRIGETNYYHLFAACYEYKPVIGKSPERMAQFSENLLSTLKESEAKVFAWCVLPNHYHLLVYSEQVLKLIRELGKCHGRNSFKWNGEEDKRGRKVWHNLYERYIRNERHFWVTMNYVHNNPVHHNYVAKWQDWAFSSAIAFLTEYGREKAMEIWRKYPVLGYGKGWDEGGM